MGTRLIALNGRAVIALSIKDGYHHHILWLSQSDS